MIVRSWRLFLGLAIGGGLGYALVLLARPGQRRSERWHTLYQATPEQREEQPTA